jgi:hypothetical protein
MANEAVFRGAQYRLRAAAPMPVGGTNYGSASFAAGEFVLHTFGAEVNDVDIYDCTTVLPASSDFRGQGLGGNLISASFSRIGDKSGSYFQGRKVYAPSYVDEGDFNLL